MKIFRRPTSATLQKAPPAMPPCIDKGVMYSTKKVVGPGMLKTQDPRAGNSACWKLKGSLGQFCGKSYHPQCPLGSQGCKAPDKDQQLAGEYADWVNYKCFVKRKSADGRVLACGKDKTETFEFCSPDAGGTTGSGDQSL